MVELSAGRGRRKSDIGLCLRSVSARTNPRYFALISGFFSRTGVPILLNTSLNENGPVVRTPAEAISCFLRTDMDALVLGTQVIDRHAPDFPEHYRKRVDKD